MNYQCVHFCQLKFFADFWTISWECTENFLERKIWTTAIEQVCREAAGLTYLGLPNKGHLLSMLTQFWFEICQYGLLGGQINSVWVWGMGIHGFIKDTPSSPIDFHTGGNEVSNLQRYKGNAIGLDKCHWGRDRWCIFYHWNSFNSRPFFLWVGNSLTQKWT